MMANDKVQPKMKKKPKIPWLQNTMRSAGIATKEVFSEMTPSLSSTAKGVASTTKSTLDKLKQSQKSGSGKNAIANNSWVQMSKRTIDRAIKDLKSGQWQDKSREDELIMKSIGLDDDFMNDMNDLGDFADFGDGYGDGENVSFTYVNEGDSGTTAEAGLYIAESVNAGTEATLQASKAQIDAMAAISNANLEVTQKFGSQMTESLANINNTLSAILQYHEENTTKFYEASISYMEKMGPKQDDDEDYTPDKMDASEMFDSSGKFDFNKYLTLVKQQAKDLFQNSIVGSTMELFNTEKVEAVVANPIHILTKLGIQKLIPSMVKESLTGIENAFRDLVPNMLAQLGNASQSGKFGIAATIQEYVGKILGVKNGAYMTREFDLTDKVSTEAAVFDGVTRNSITEVLPKYARESTMYLKIIAEKVAGTEKVKKGMEDVQVYDATENRYLTKDEVQQSIAYQLQDALAGAYRNTEFGSALQYGGSTLKDKNLESYERLTEQLLTYMTQNTKNLSVKDMNIDDEESEINKILKEVGGNGESAKAKQVLKETLRQMYREDVGVSKVAGAQLKARKQYEDLVKDMSQNWDKYNLSNAGIDSDTDIYEFLDQAFHWKEREKQEKKEEKKQRRLNRIGIGERIEAEVHDLRTSDHIAKEGLSQMVYKSGDKYKNMFDENGHSTRKVRYKANGLGTAFSNAGSHLQASMSQLMRGNGEGAAAEIGQIFSESMKGLWDSFKDSFITPFKETIFGKKNDEGYLENGVFQGLQNKTKDTWNAMKMRITGSSYKDSNGEWHTTETDDVKPAFAIVKDTMQNIGNAIHDKLFGVKEDEEDGEAVVTGLVGNLKKGLVDWKNALFGTEDEDIDKSIAEMKKKAMDAIPGAAAGAIGGAATGIAAGGLLGTLIGGPVGGAIIGMGLSFAKKSNAFQRYVFGEEIEDENGNKRRIGGLISQKTQEMFKDPKIKAAVIGGGALGLMKNTLMGSSGGLLGNLVGGPLAGALLGAGTGLLLKSGMFQKFLFGDEEKGKTGLFQHIKNIWGKKDKDGDEKNGIPNIGAALVGAGGGALTAALIGKVGIMGAALTPFGPIGGALLGLGAGIKLSSKTFRERLFGKKNEETGEREGGLLGKMGSWMYVEVIAPLKSSILDFGDFVRREVKYEILEPFRIAVEPIGKAVVGGLGKLVDRARKFGGKVKDNFTEKILKPLGKITASIFNPIRKTISTIAKVGVKASLAIVELPAKIMLQTAKFITDPFVKLAHNIRKKILSPLRKALFWVIKSPFKLAGWLLKMGAGATVYAGRKVTNAVSNVRNGIGLVTGRRKNYNKEYRDNGDFRSEYRRLKKEKKQDAKAAKQERKIEEDRNWNRRQMARILGYDVKYFTEDNMKAAEEAAKAQHKKLQWKGNKKQKDFFEPDQDKLHREKMAALKTDSLINRDGKNDDVEVKQLTETTKIRAILEKIGEFFTGKNPLKAAIKDRAKLWEKEKEANKDRKKYNGDAGDEFEALADEFEAAGGIGKWAKNKIKAKIRGNETLDKIVGQHEQGDSGDDIDFNNPEEVREWMNQGKGSGILGTFDNIKNAFKRKNRAHADGGTIGPDEVSLVGDRGGDPEDAEIIVPHTRSTVLSQSGDGIKTTVTEIQENTLKKMAKEFAKEYIKEEREEQARKEAEVTRNNTSDILSAGSVLADVVENSEDITNVLKDAGLGNIFKSVSDIFGDTGVGKWLRVGANVAKLVEGTKTGQKIGELKHNATSRIVGYHDPRIVEEAPDIEDTDAYADWLSRTQGGGSGLIGAFDKVKDLFGRRNRAHAKGGDVEAGKPILVGDGGTDPSAAEIMVPKTNSKILSQKNDGIRVYINGIAKQAAQTIGITTGKEVAKETELAEKKEKSKAAAVRIGGFSQAVIDGFTENWDNFDAPTKKAINRQMRKNGFKGNGLQTEKEQAEAKAKREASLEEMKKSGSYQSRQAAKIAAEKEERQMSMLEAIKEHTKTSAVNTGKSIVNWLKIFGKAGLITLLLPKLIPFIKGIWPIVETAGKALGDIASFIGDWAKNDVLGSISKQLENLGKKLGDNKDPGEKAADLAEEAGAVISDPLNADSWKDFITNDDGTLSHSRAAMLNGARGAITRLPVVKGAKNLAKYGTIKPSLRTKFNYKKTQHKKNWGKWLDNTRDKYYKNKNNLKNAFTNQVDDIAEDAIKNQGDDVVEVAAKQAGKKGAKKGVEAGVKETTEKTSKKLMDKVIKMVTEGIGKVSDKILGKLGSKGVQKSVEQGTKSGMKGIISTCIKNLKIVLKKGFHKIAPKVSAILAATGAAVGSGIGAIALAIKDVGFGGVLAINEMSNPRRLFRLDSDTDIDWIMEIIAAGVGILKGTSIGGIIDLVDGLGQEIINFFLIGFFADSVYKLICRLIGDNDKIEKLNEGQEEQEKKYDKYVEKETEKQYKSYLKSRNLNEKDYTLDNFKKDIKDGKATVETKSFAEFNNSENKTLGTKIGDGVLSLGNKLKNSGLGKAFLGEKKEGWYDPENNLFYLKSGKDYYEMYTVETVDKDGNPDKITPTGDKIHEDNLPDTSNMIEIKENSKGIVDHVGDTAKAAVKGVGHTFSNIFSTAKNAAAGFTKGGLKGGFTNLAAGISKTAKQQITDGKKLLGTAVGGIKGIGSNIAGLFGFGKKKSKEVEDVAATVNDKVSTELKDSNKYYKEFGITSSPNTESKASEKNKGYFTPNGQGYYVKNKDGTFNHYSMAGDLVEENIKGEDAEKIQQSINFGIFKEGEITDKSKYRTYIENMQKAVDKTWENSATISTTNSTVTTTTSTSYVPFGGKGIGGFGSQLLGGFGEVISGLKSLISSNKEKKEATASIGGYGENVVNKYPYYSQEDSEWKDKDYSYGRENGTIEEAGCGPTAMAMVASKYKNRITPDMMAKEAIKSGYRDKTGTNAGFISYESNKLGIESKEEKNVTAAKISENVGKGKSMILNGVDTGEYSDSPFTESGHYVVAVGKDYKGNILINDPRGEEYSVAIDPKVLAEETRVGWRFSDTEMSGKGGFGQQIKNFFGGFGKKKSKTSNGWMEAVEKTKKSFASTKPGHFNSNGHQTITITTNGGSKRVAGVRTDAAGFVGACLDIYIGTDKFHGLKVSDYTKDNKSLRNAKFIYKKWPGWKKLQAGDILVAKGNKHIEIYAGKIKKKDYSYSAGTAADCNEAGTTKSSKNYEYTHIFRLKRDPGHVAVTSTVNNESGEVVVTDGASTRSTEKKDTSTPSWAQGSILGKIQNIFSQVGTKALDGMLSGNWNFDFSEQSTEETGETTENSGSSSYTGNMDDSAAMRVFNDTWIEEMGKKGPGYIAPPLNDGAGKNYGAASFTQKYNITGFTNWLKKNHPELGNKLKGSPASSEYDSSWKALGSSDEKAFLNSQIEYTFINKLEPALNTIKSKTGVDLNNGKYSEGLFSVLLSMSNQRPAWTNEKWVPYLSSHKNASNVDIINNTAGDIAKNYSGNYASAIRNRYNRQVSHSLAMNTPFKYARSAFGGNGVGGFGDMDYPYYSQTDSRWANKDYSADNDGGTMGDAGCGPTAMAMVASNYTGYGTPEDLAYDAMNTGFRDETGTNSNFINYESDKLGLDASETDNVTAAEISNGVGNGKSMILNGVDTGSYDSSAFTRAGHYVVATGKDKNGNILINDPRGEEYSVAIDPNVLASESRAGWKFGKKKGGFGQQIKDLFGGFGKKKNKKKKKQKETNTANTGNDWIGVVRSVHKAYSNESIQHGYEYDDVFHKININGQEYSCRWDCSGYVSACLVVYGEKPKGWTTNSGGFASSGLALKNFKYMNWPGWDNLQEGDIIAKSGHVEIFAYNKDGSHYVYNAGSTPAIKATSPTRSSKPSYTGVWRPNNPGSGVELVTGSSSSNGSPDSATVSTTSNTGNTLLEKVANIFSEFGTKALNGLTTGNWDYNFTSDSSSGGTTSNSTGTSSSVELSGKGNKKKIFNYLTGDEKLTKEAAAGIMGCWEAESTNKPDTLEGAYLKGAGKVSDIISSNANLDKFTTGILFPAYKKSGISINKNAYKVGDHYYPGLGLAQWTGPRAKNLEKFAKKKNADWGALSTQLDFFSHAEGEFSSKGSLRSKLNKAKSAEDAATLFLDGFEMNKEGWHKTKQGSSQNTKRRGFAKSIYDKYGKEKTGKGGFGIFGGFGNYEDYLKLKGINPDKKKKKLGDKKYKEKKHEANVSAKHLGWRKITGKPIETYWQYLKSLGKDPKKIRKKIGEENYIKLRKPANDDARAVGWKKIKNNLKKGIDLLKTKTKKLTSIANGDIKPLSGKVSKVNKNPSVNDKINSEDYPERFKIPVDEPQVEISTTTNNDWYSTNEDNTTVVEDLKKKFGDPKKSSGYGGFGKGKKKQKKHPLADINRRSIGQFISIDNDTTTPMSSISNRDAFTGFSEIEEASTNKTSSVEKIEATSKSLENEVATSNDMNMVVTNLKEMQLPTTDLLHSILEVATEMRDFLSNVTNNTTSMVSGINALKGIIGTTNNTVVNNTTNNNNVNNTPQPEKNTNSTFSSASRNAKLAEQLARG